jgi:hypothetical protein
VRNTVHGVGTKRLTPWLTGAGSRRLEGTNINHEDAEGMAYVGVRVEPTVRLGRVGSMLYLQPELMPGHLMGQR